MLGTAKMGLNRPGPGSHVATASFMVASDARGRGVATALCRFALDWARAQDFAGMQFNAVAESNHAAVAIYERLGFRTIGTVPGAMPTPPSAASACTSCIASCERTSEGRVMRRQT
ncbi:MAG TPA: GNAT family N-acetyltransferase [Geminicoccaceae bacterium]|nr:GNAT family N-acetyltransferase [Geminicoccaceae bacterium]